MPRILPFKDPEPEEINGFKDITEAVNFLDINYICLFDYLFISS